MKKKIFWKIEVEVSNLDDVKFELNQEIEPTRTQIVTRLNDRFGIDSDRILGISIEAPYEVPRITCRY